MFRAIAFLLLFHTVALLGQAEDEAPFLEVERAEIRRIIELGYNLDPATEGSIARLRDRFPGSVVPDLLEVGRLYWHQKYVAIDAELSVRFEAEALRSLKKAKDYVDAHPGSVDAEFVVAMIELSLGLHYVEQKRWWPGFWKARSGLAAAKRILREHPDYADAKLPLGMANCYLAEAPSYLKPIAFLLRFDGNMERGLRYMEEVKADGLFGQVDASYYLAAIHIDLREDRLAALGELEVLTERFPHNVDMQKFMADLERAEGRCESSVERYLRILDLDQMKSVPVIRLQAELGLCWSALCAQRWELARQASFWAERTLAEHEVLHTEAGWPLIARAEATLAEGDRDGALSLYASIKRDSGRAYDRAQVRIAEVKAQAGR